LIIIGESYYFLAILMPKDKSRKIDFVETIGNIKSEEEKNVFVDLINKIIVYEQENINLYKIY